MAKPFTSGQTTGSSSERFELEPTTTPSPRPVKARPRSLFWPGFIAGFLLLTLLSLGGLAMLAGVTPLRIGELQTQAGSWTPPPAPPTAEVVEQPAADPALADQDTPAGFAVGDSLRNITPSQVNIRRTPGYLSKPEGDVVGQVAPNQSVELLGGRAAADNLTWWYIRYRTPGGQVIEGWIAEATASGVQILGQ
jgi:hypothetical protein